MKYAIVNSDCCKFYYFYSYFIVKICFKLLFTSSCIWFVFVASCSAVFSYLLFTLTSASFCRSCCTTAPAASMDSHDTRFCLVGVWLGSILISRLQPSQQLSAFQYTPTLNIFATRSIHPFRDDIYGTNCKVILEFSLQYRVTIR